MKGYARPTYRSGFAAPTRNRDFKYPSLWRGCFGAWNFGLGPTGSRVIDHSGRGNHGTLTNMDPATDWVTSGGGSAVDFDGSNDYIDCGASSNITGNLTLSAWVYHAGASQPVIIFKGDFQVSGYYWQVGRLGGGDLAFVTNQAGTFQSTSTPGSFVTTNTWLHLAVILRGSSAKIYKNGVEGTYAATGTHTAPASSSTNMRIGSYSSGYNLLGMIDDVRTYNRALTEAELRTLATRRGIAYERKRRTVVRGSSVATYTATASLVAGGADFSGSATFTKPTYSGLASLTSGNAEFSGSATFDEPVYTASAALECGGALFSGNAEFDQPAYSGSAALTVGGAEFIGSGTTTQPTYSGSASLVAGGAEISASAEFDQPTYTGSASLTCGGAEFSGSGVTTNTFTATGSFVVGGAEFAGSATFTPPTYTASGSFTTGGAEITASATFATNTYTSSASLLAGGAEIAASGTFTKPTYSGTASLVCGGAEFSGTSGTSSVFVPYYYLMMMGG